MDCRDSHSVTRPPDSLQVDHEEHLVKSVGCGWKGCMDSPRSASGSQVVIATEVTVQSGDEAAFAALIEPYRRRLHVHCYRMLGSFDDAKDLVQETFLRAWRGRAGFEGRSTVGTWLYRIATNACLDFLASRSRRLGSIESTQVAEASLRVVQPCPDGMLDKIASGDSGPDELVIARETIELAY